MRILFIFTGGTIGSTESGGVRQADLEKPYKIISAYRERYGLDFEYDTAEPYTELSENFTGEHIRALIAEVKCGLKGDYDGIIVTHGTDTLQYSAAALGYALGLDTIPVLLVSANAPIEDSRSNGLANLRAAVRFIGLRAGLGVFTVYSDGCDGTLVHRATRLLPPKAFSDECASIFGQSFGRFNEKFEYAKNADFYERADETDVISAEHLSERSKGILMLTPYVGMMYPSLDGIKWIVMNTYHSGTLDVKSESALRFFGKARELGATVFAVGTTEELCYASSAEFSKLGIIPLDNISPPAAYMKLWMLTSEGRDPRLEMRGSLSGDVCGS